jgi:PAP2 superfamily
VPISLPERGPSELDSKEWARDYNLTRLFGAKTGSLRTPEQTDVGLFWSDHATAQYARAFRKLAADQRLDTSDTARLLAMLMTVQADAFIGCMNAKYHFTFWRPYTAIRNGDIDGNPDTVADPNWLPLAPTPPHPEYPAAHGCVTSATANVLKRFFGTDDVHFSVDSLAFGVVQPIRQFSSFHGLVLEVRQARIYGGMHYHHSIVQGEILGTNVARQLVKNYFRSRNDD